ncbi:MAG: hypothetical protein V4642_11080 [Bacteroidota bacterium]
MKKQFFASAATLTLIAGLFMAGCERTKNTDDVPQPTPEPVQVPAEIQPIQQDSMSTAALDSIAKVDSLATARVADSISKATGKAVGTTTPAATGKKSTTKSGTKITTTTSTGNGTTSTSTSKKGTGTSTGSGSTSTTTQKKGSGTSTTTTTTTGSGGTTTTTTTQKKGTNP